MDLEISPIFCVNLAHMPNKPYLFYVSHQVSILKKVKYFSIVLKTNKGTLFIAYKNAMFK